MKVLVLYTKDRTEVFNRKSAMGSYINCLGNLLKPDHEVFLNGVFIEDIPLAKEDTSVHIRTRNKIKLMIPSFVKRFIKERRLLNNVKKFKNELLDSNIKYDRIIEFYNFGSDVGLALAKKNNCPLLITYDGPIEEEYVFFNGSKPVFRKYILKKQKESLLFASKIVVYSNPMKTYVSDITNRKDNIELHQNVDFTRFDHFGGSKQSISGNINICFIGSFLKWHQVELLVRSFSNCIMEGLKVSLFLVGDGMEKANVENLVSSLDNKIKSHIFFTGFLDGEELFELKKKMHIGVMPGSNWYGAPNKIFEYGAMNMAVVAPDTPTIVDLFTQEEVCFFKWKDFDSLNINLKSLLLNTNQLKTFSNQLNLKIKDKYTEQNTVDFYNNILDRF